MWIMEYGLLPLIHLVIDELDKENLKVTFSKARYHALMERRSNHP